MADEKEVQQEHRIGCVWIVLAAVLLLFAVSLHAEPIAAFTNGNVTITITNEPCQLKDRVELPNRVTWREGQKVYEGCAGKYGTFLIGYFDDRTIALIPIVDLKPVDAI